MAALGVDAKTLDLKIVRHRAKTAPCQKLKGSLGAFIGIKLRLLLFDFIEETRKARIILVERDTEAFEFGQHSAFARLTRNQQPAMMAIGLRDDVLVCRRLFHHG